ncbi:J domain-containing protein [Campylobacter sp. MG1]|uniref:J domain-containing protein n=1 Tax=Campylobacter sp. MG1 TaxID=2976332 RepID=UPI00226CD42F|nr:J domain-containing protein [Campylobacter sp. MG1]
MQIIQNLNSIIINTDDFELFTKIKKIITKNFSSNIGKKSKIISFYIENELTQRIYFLKFISALNKKYNNETIQNINHSYYKMFKLKLVDINSLNSTLNCNLNFNKKYIILNFNILERKIISYLNNYFQNHNTSVINNKFIITYKDENTLNLLNTFCEYNEHLNYYINFTLDEFEYLKFKNEIKNEIKKDNKFLNICMLLEEHFHTLGIKTGASFNEVRNAYLKLSKQYHPDFHNDKNDEVKRLLKDKFEKINLAYESLKPLYKNKT